MPMTADEFDEAVLHAEERVIDLITDYLMAVHQNRIPSVEEIVQTHGLTEEEAIAALQGYVEEE